VLFGAGRRSELGEIAGSFSGAVFLALDPFLASVSAGREIQSILAAAGLRLVTFSQIDPDPDCAAVDAAGHLARRERCELVVAAGGGSAIDFGKGVAVVAGNEGTAWQYTRRKDHTPLIPGPDTLPVIAIPSTAGTGSEMTHYAVFNNATLREKSTIVSDRIVPRVAIVDPELTYSCSPSLTAYTGVDVLAHAIEAFINTQSTPFARLVSLEAIRLVAQHLPAAVAHGSDSEARQQMAWASSLGGIAIAHANPTLPHALGQAAGGYLHAPHGASIAACLPEVIRRTQSASPEAFAAVARAMEPSVAARNQDHQAAELSSLVDGLFQRIGAGVRLGSLGLKEGDIDRVTEIALTGYFTGISLHPRVVEAGEIKEIYRACL
jgi:alcohol dehydrogenase class IV